MTVLEQIPTELQRDGRPLFRRVYLVCDAARPLPTDDAPGSIALVRQGAGVITKILFPDGVWGQI